MMNIVKLRKKPELKQAAANWFHEKQGIPLETYLTSMEFPKGVRNYTF